MDIDFDDDEEVKRVAMSKMLQQLDTKFADSSQFITDIPLNKNGLNRMMGKKAYTAQARSR